MNIQSALKKGQAILRLKNIKSAELDCQILMSEAINREKKFLIIKLQRFLEG